MNKKTERLTKKEYWNSIYDNKDAQNELKSLHQYTKKNSPLRPILKVCKNLQLLLNPIFRLIFNEKSIENKFFSPYLICIGEKS